MTRVWFCNNSTYLSAIDPRYDCQLLTISCKKTKRRREKHTRQRNNKNSFTQQHTESNGTRRIERDRRHYWTPVGEGEQRGEEGRRGGSWDRAESLISARLCQQQGDSKGLKWGNSSEGETQSCCRTVVSSLTQALLLPAKFNEFRHIKAKVLWSC